jgi:hypothetical protein
MPTIDGSPLLIDRGVKSLYFWIEAGMSSAPYVYYVVVIGLYKQIKAWTPGSVDIDRGNGLLRSRVVSVNKTKLLPRGL